MKSKAKTVFLATLAFSELVAFIGMFGAVLVATSVHAKLTDRNSM